MTHHYSVVNAILLIVTDIYFVLIITSGQNSIGVVNPVLSTN